MISNVDEWHSPFGGQLTDSIQNLEYSYLGVFDPVIYLLVSTSGNICICAQKERFKDLY